MERLDTDSKAPPWSGATESGRAQETVFVVDDDEAVGRSLRRLMKSVGLPVEVYINARSFLDRFDPSRPGCLLLDIRMRGMSGLELQEKLVREGIRIPVIIISAHGDVEKAVRAMKGGAVDFIKKPYKGKVLLSRIRQALELDARIRREETERAEVARRFALLTPREREVMDLLVTGQSCKQIALELGLSSKTVDIHRHHVMTKLRIESLVELVRMAQIRAGRLGTPLVAHARGDFPISRSEGGLEP